MWPMANALTIAGSDSVGGAGLQADMKAFEAVGVHACAVVTCVTSQNTRGVDSIFPLPEAEVARQLRSVLEDVELDAVKTGMLYSPPIVKTVAKMLRNVDAKLVVDPVMVATTGSSLRELDEWRSTLAPGEIRLTNEGAPISLSVEPRRAENYLDEVYINVLGVIPGKGAMMGLDQHEAGAISVSRLLRDAVGYEIEIGIGTHVQFNTYCAIRIAKILEKY